MRISTITTVLIAGLIGITSASAEEVVASNYTIKLGHILADNTRYRGELVIASLTLPFGTRVKLINGENGRTARAVVKDRGPFVKGRDIDLSKAVARKLGVWRQGISHLAMEVDPA